MAVVINGDTGISPVTASGTSASVDGMTVGRGGGEVATNTAVGAGVLAANTTGNGITAIGSGALAANTDGNGNIAIGGSTPAVTGAAMAANTTGYWNTAVGSGALRLNTSGALNVAMGFQALQANTTASNNTAVGYQAGNSNTTSGFNTFLGYQAGNTFNYTGGNGYNCFIGSRAGTAVTTGQLNCFVGDASGLAATTGSGNTFIGQSSGNSITTGGKNTIIGGYTGNQGGLDIRTASNYVVLSDGDGNPRATCNDSGRWLINGFTVVDVARISVSFDSANSTGVSYKALAGAGGTVSTIWNSSNSTVGSITTTGSATAFNTTSDYRLKNTIAPMTGALNKVLQLKPVTYKWNRDGSNAQGFIAHELQAVVPDCVTGEKDAVDSEGNPKYQQVDTSFLVATLTAAIQELKAEFDAYKATHP